MNQDDKFKLTEQGMVTLADWIGTLVEAGYDYDNTPGAIWQAAGYLVANDHSDYSVDVTAVLLGGFGVDVWQKVYDEFRDEVQPNS